MLWKVLTKSQRNHVIDHFFDGSEMFDVVKSVKDLGFYKICLVGVKEWWDNLDRVTRKRLLK